MNKQAMHKTDFSKLDVTGLQTPCYVVDRVAVENNLKVLHEVQEASGAKILHALKAFSMHALADLTVKYLSGTCSSGLQEALLAQEFYGGENHVFSPAYSHKDLEEILAFADHVIFNSCSQLLLHEKACREALAKRPGIVFGRMEVHPPGAGALARPLFADDAVFPSHDLLIGALRAHDPGIIPTGMP